MAGIKKLLDDLKEQRKRYRGTKREAVDTLIRYISTNEEQMRYDVFRAKGYDIGSGAVEGACKHVVGKRLKQSRYDLEQSRFISDISGKVWRPVCGSKTSWSR